MKEADNNFISEPEETGNHKRRHDTSEEALHWSDLVKIFEGLDYGKGCNIDNREVFLLGLACFTIKERNVESYASLFEHDQPYGVRKTKSPGWHLIHDFMLRELKKPQLTGTNERNRLASLADMMSITRRKVARGKPYMAGFLLLFMKVIYDLIPIDSLELKVNFYDMFRKELMAKETIDILIGDKPEWLTPQLIEPTAVFLPSVLAVDLPNAVDIGPIEYLVEMKEKVQKEIQLTQHIREQLKLDSGDIYGLDVLKNVLRKRSLQKNGLEAFKKQIQEFYDEICVEENKIDTDIEKGIQSYQNAQVSTSLMNWLVDFRSKYLPTISHGDFMREFVPSAIVQYANKMGKVVSDDDSFKAWMGRTEVDSDKNIPEPSTLDCRTSEAVAGKSNKRPTAQLCSPQFAGVNLEGRVSFGVKKNRKDEEKNTFTQSREMKRKKKEALSQFEVPSEFEMPLSLQNLDNDDLDEALLLNTSP